MKPQPVRVDTHGRWYAMPSGGESLNCYDCPHGTVGDRLYVKESHYLWGRWDLNGYTKTGKQKYRFRRTTTEVRYRDNPPTEHLVKGKSINSSKWHKRSALFMEKKDARLWMEIVEVRVERVREISEEDAKAEGCKLVDYATGRECILKETMGSYRLTFRDLWESIHGPGSWERNDWVWVIGYRRVQP